MLNQLDCFENQRDSIQEKFQEIIKYGLNEKFIAYYNEYLKDVRYNIDYNNFGISNNMESLNSSVNILSSNGVLLAKLNEERVDLEFYLDGTLERVPIDCKYKFSRYYRVYTYILKFCDLGDYEILYLYKLFKAKRGNFILLGYLSEGKNELEAFLELIDKNISDGARLLLELE